ncbi:MAG: DUF424 family protein [Methanosarcinales archaeon]|nr:DUF424 family protein [Methanosarcinales archaeon]
MEETMCLKTYRVGKEVLVAACDLDLMGRKFAEGELQLDVNSEFFGDQRATPSDLEAAMMNATMANFVGARTVEWAIGLNYVDRDNILLIEGIPCAQMVRM